MSSLLFLPLGFASFSWALVSGSSEGGRWQLWANLDLRSGFGRGTKSSSALAGEWALSREDLRDFLQLQFLP